MVFDEYNTSKFTGWPSASNPYESGSPNAPTNEVVILHLKPDQLDLAPPQRPLPVSSHAGSGRAAELGRRDAESFDHSDRRTT